MINWDLALSALLLALSGVSLLALLVYAIYLITLTSTKRAVVAGLGILVLELSWVLYWVLLALQGGG